MSDLSNIDFSDGYGDRRPTRKSKALATIIERLERWQNTP